jgi:superfamily II DNA or RNA helicase
MPNLTAYVASQIYLTYPTDMEKVPFFETMKAENKIINPAYAKHKALNISCVGVAKYYYFWRVQVTPNYRYFILSRGYQNRVKQLAKHYGIVIDWVDKTIFPSLKKPFPKPNYDLDQFQEIAIQSLIKFETGCLVAPTGSGKTNMLLSVIHLLQTPTLILVHTKSLLEQTVKRCKQNFGIKSGILGGGKRSIKPITVAMIQTLSRAKSLQDLSKEFGLIVVDEAHHSPCNSWRKILDTLPARYKYGFTATAWRKDQLEFIMWKVIGRIRHKVERQEAVDAGRIMVPKVEWQKTQFTYDFEHSNWIRMISALAKNRERNKLILETVQQRLTTTSRALVLTDRIRHAKRLAILLNDLEPAVLTGDMDSSTQKFMMERIRKGTRLTIATIHLLGEGVDVPGWDLLFLVSPFSPGPRVLQALGRITRTSTNKFAATLIDFVDVNVPKLLHAARGRKQLYLYS